MTYAFRLCNKATEDAVDQLGKVYKLSDRAAILQRVVALAVIGAKHADKDGNLKLRDMRRGHEGRIVIIKQRSS